MKTLEKKTSQQRFGNTNGKGNSLEAQVGKWYKPPVLHTVLTEELAHEIAECFLDGCTDEDTAVLCDVSIAQLRNWRSLEIIRKYETERKLFYVHEVRDGKRRDWTRLAWWLERRYPLEFSRPEVAHAISTSIHTSVNTTQNLIVSSELAEQLLERNARISTKIEELFSNRPNKGGLPLQVSDKLALASEEEQRITNARVVKDIVDSTTLTDSVVDIPNIGPNNPPFDDPGGVTPSAAVGPTTDTLSPTAPQKTKYLGRKAVKALLQIPENTKNYGNSDETITRKNLDMSLRGTKKENVRKTEPLELEGQVRKVRTKSIIGEEEKKNLRATMIEEIRARKKAAKFTRGELQKANHEVDKIHPRKARK